ncbi:MAG: hypothetical protein AAB439_02975 [Patescibacteria group bacterium]
MKKTYFYLGLALLVAVGALWYFSPERKGETQKETEVVTQEEAKKTESTAPSASVTTPSVPQGGQRIIENGIPVTLIYLTTLGFSPNEVTITAGEEVRFVNKTDGVMRVGTKANASTSYYSSFAQPNAVGKGGTFQIGLIREGLWTYENLNAPSSGVTGVVYIK